MRNFRELKVWEKSHELCLSIYEATKQFPKEEVYGLTSQIRRASVSITTNIAEGCCRDGDAEFARFLGIALGSTSEVEYLLLLTKELNFLGEQIHQTLTNNTQEVKMMLAALFRKLKPAANS